MCLVTDATITAVSTMAAVTTTTTMATDGTMITTTTSITTTTDMEPTIASVTTATTIDSTMTTTTTTTTTDMAPTITSVTAAATSTITTTPTDMEPTITSVTAATTSTITTTPTDMEPTITSVTTAATTAIDSTITTTIAGDMASTITSVTAAAVTTGIVSDSTAINSTPTSIMSSAGATGTIATNPGTSTTMAIGVTTSSTAPPDASTQTTTTVSDSTTITTAIDAITTVSDSTASIDTTTANIPSNTATTTTTSAPSTTATASSPATVSSVNTPSTDDSSSSDSNNVTIIAVVSIVVVILLIAIIIVFIVMIHYWKKRWNAYHVYGGKTDDDDTELDEQLPVSPLYATINVTEVKNTTNEIPTAENVQYNHRPPQPYAVVNKKEKKEKKKSTELQKRSSIEFERRSQCSPDISIRSSQEPPTLSVVNPDYELTSLGPLGLGIFSSVPDIPERTEASHGGKVFDDKDEENPIYNLNENPMYSEAINPTSIISDLSSNYSAADDKVSPYASIYAEPLPLVKSEGPPVVSTLNIRPLRKLGVGLFGEVMLAETVGLSYRYLGIGNSTDDTISMKVAVKMLKSSPCKEIQNSFEKEIKFMSRLKDDNVIRLLGICTTGTPFIMMEYMMNGDLNGYLQNLELAYNTDKLPTAKEITLIALIYMSYQIASGMKYLSSRNFIHRDLAARNILVGINYTVKIADFGMSQNLYSEYYCRIGGQKILPIRWMACECFYGKFSVKTDVWAFGITLWEIFTLCQCLPFDDLTNQELIEDAVKGADRKIPKQPKFCPNEIYKIMKSCWHHDPSERAQFNVLCHQLNEYYSSIL